MEHSKAVCFRLISNNLSDVDHHCSLCLFFHGSNNTCQHTQPTTSPRSETPFSDCSFYTCRTVASRISTTSLGSDSSGSSTSTIKAHVKVSMFDLKQHSLRRKQSPTHASLRELNHQQASLRTRESEEHLQAVYERQILQYLNSDIDLTTDLDLWTIDE